MILGELGNLVAYSLAKPSLISPLGAVSVVVNVPVAYLVRFPLPPCFLSNGGRAFFTMCDRMLRSVQEEGVRMAFAVQGDGARECASAAGFRSKERQRKEGDDTRRKRSERARRGAGARRGERSSQGGKREQERGTEESVTE